MKNNKRSIGTIIKWALYSAAITVVAAPFSLLIIEKTVTLDSVKAFLLPVFSGAFGTIYAEQYTLLLFSSIVILIVFLIVLFITRNTKIAIKIYANYDRIN